MKMGPTSILQTTIYIYIAAGQREAGGAQLYWQLAFVFAKRNVAYLQQASFELQPTSHDHCLRFGSIYHYDKRLFTKLLLGEEGVPGMS